MVQATKLTITTSYATRVCVPNAHAHSHQSENEAILTTEISTLGKKHQVETNEVEGGWA